MTASYADLEACMQYTNDVIDGAYICDIINKMAKNTTKGETSAYWPIPVDVIGFSEIISNCSDTPRPEQQ